MRVEMYLIQILIYQSAIIYIPFVDTPFIATPFTTNPFYRRPLMRVHVYYTCSSSPRCTWTTESCGGLIAASRGLVYFQCRTLNSAEVSCRSWRRGCTAAAAFPEGCTLSDQWGGGGREQKRVRGSEETPLTAPASSGKQPSCEVS